MSKLLILLLICLIGLTGCTTTAGPYVTDVSFDGEGNLMITKNTVVLNAFLGAINNGDKPQTIIITVPK